MGPVASRSLVLDSSAIVALLLNEAGSTEFQQLIGDSDKVLVGAPTILESLMVLQSRVGHAEHLLGRLLNAAEAIVVPLDDVHAAIAFEAFTKYGKGRHPAALNFGDCMAYAIAKAANLPLLFVGADFTKTDIDPAH